MEPRTALFTFSCETGRQQPVNIDFKPLHCNQEQSDLHEVFSADVVVLDERWSEMSSKLPSLVVLIKQQDKTHI